MRKIFIRHLIANAARAFTYDNPYATPATSPNATLRVNGQSFEITGTVLSSSSFPSDINMQTATGAEIVGDETCTITEIAGDTFYHTHFEKVILPSVTTIGVGAFYEGGATEISLPNVESIPTYCFWGAGGIKKIDLPNVTSIANTAFPGNMAGSTLEEITLTSMTKSQVQAGKSAWQMPIGYGCVVHCSDGDIII